MCTGLLLTGWLVTGGCGFAVGTEERQAVAVLTWTKRGAELGALVQLYCYSASPRHQRIMRESIESNAGRVAVVIRCPGEE